MLIVKRRAGDGISLYTSDGLIEIQIQKTDIHQVSIGIKAPESVTIWRSEIDPEQYGLTQQTLMQKLSGFWKRLRRVKR